MLQACITLRKLFAEVHYVSNEYKLGICVCFRPPQTIINLVDRFKEVAALGEILVVSHLRLQRGVDLTEVQQNCLAEILLSLITEQVRHNIWGVVAQKLTRCFQVLRLGLAVFPY